ARERPYASLDWRLVSPTEADWERYRELVGKAAARAHISWLAQRIETVARWVNGRPVAAPQYHIWLYRDGAVEARIRALYDEVDPERRREHWRWLLAWTPPAGSRTPTPSVCTGTTPTSRSCGSTTTSASRRSTRRSARARVCAARPWPKRRTRTFPTSPRSRTTSPAVRARSRSSSCSSAPVTRSSV